MSDRTVPVSQGEVITGPGVPGGTPGPRGEVLKLKLVPRIVRTQKSGIKRHSAAEPRPGTTRDLVPSDPGTASFS
eukprot:765492-Hanusia_phi.AAC.1